MTKFRMYAYSIGDKMNTTQSPKNGDMRVWWTPQVPMKPFRVLVSSLAEGVKIMDVLANYDLFQLENNIKPDYSNAGGIEVYDGDLFDWLDWCDEDTGEDDPKAFLSQRCAV